MNANAETHPVVVCNSLAFISKRLLYLNRTLDRIDNAGKLSEHTIARGVGYSAPVLGNQPVHDFPVSSQRPQRA